MAIEITKDLVEEIQLQLEAGQNAAVANRLEEMHPADIADLVDKLPQTLKLRLIKLFDDEIQSDIMSELEEDEREELLEELSPEEIAENVVEHMESDDAADLIGELSEDKKEKVIEALGDDEHASDIKDLLSYPEDTAGALMAKELIQVNVNWTIHECIIELRKQAEDVEQIHTVYAIDDQEKLIGRISLKDLIVSSDQRRVEEIVKKDIVVVLASATENEVMQKMEKYDMVVLPVVDEQQRLIGRITIDDVVDVMKEEAEKDYQMASGISENVEIDDNIWQLTKARLPWLLVGLAGGIAGAKVIGVFGVVEEVPLLAYFVPLIAAMGGNVGVQSSAIVVQSIANNTLSGSVWSKLLKELGVGLLNGIMCSLILLVFNIFFVETKDFALTLAISASLFSVIIFAAVFGTWVPLVLHRYKIDPALATGPFITTSNDVIGLMLYFTICQQFI